MNRRTVLPVITMLLSTTLPMNAAPKQELRAAWGELSAVAGGRKIAIVLPDGAHVRGRVLELQNDKLVLDVPKGRTSLPRASVRSFTMTQSRTFWKVLGTTIGLGAGLAVAAPVNAYAHNEGDGAPLAVAAIIAVPTALGFLAGWLADRQTVTVIITD